MKEYINIDYKQILEQIKTLDSSLQYAACAKFLDLVRPYFCKYNFFNKTNSFFRVRCHDQGTGNYFFNNISELSYRADFFNITKFGRCNCPYESVFYCSDTALLSLIEVSEMFKGKIEKRLSYYTLSLWKMTERLNVVPLFETGIASGFNKRLLEITSKCKELIDQFKDYGKKEQLKDLHTIIGREFVIPFSREKNIYLFSSAISSYLLYEKIGQDEKLDGLVYPTCVDIPNAKNIGLNYAFNPTIIGFGNKLEFAGAYRFRIENRTSHFYETERIKFKKANKLTGEIRW